MTAGELMRRTFEVVHPEAFLEQVAARPATAAGGPLLVCDQGRLIGVLDRSEVAAWRNRVRRGARRERVRDVVPRDVLYCLESTEVAEAITLMRENHTGWIPVLGADHRPAGLLALEDAKDLAESPRATAAHADPGARPA
jgi:CBS domain-containing protein